MRVIDLLNDQEGKALKIESAEYKFVDRIVAGIINKEQQKIYDLFINVPSILNSLIAYQAGENGVKTQSAPSPDELYISGIADGMQIFYTFLNCFYKSHENSKEEAGFECQ